MKDWQMIPEIMGCNASLRMAAMQAVDAINLGRHIVVEGEAGSGRRLLARSAWCRRTPGARSLFTLDCRILRGEGAELLLFGGRASEGEHTTLQVGRLKLAAGGGVLLLHAEHLPLKAQGRLVQFLDDSMGRPRGEGLQLLLTTDPMLHAAPSLHPELTSLLIRIRVPALRERVEDIRVLADSFLQSASPLERVRCSQALIDRFCSYDWPGNVTELRAVLRRLLMESHGGLLDVRHLISLMHRDESCFALLQGGRPGLSVFDSSFSTRDSSSHNRSLQ